MKRTLVLIFVLTTLLLAACGTPASPAELASPSPVAESSPAPEATASSPAPKTIPSAAEAFPVTIEHKFGSTEVPTQPERVVTLGYSEQDPVLALGVTPVAVRDWFGDQPHAVWPWAQDELGDAKPEVLKMPFGELNFEAIAALQPDLIIGTHAGITEEEYETLAQIAPTVAQSGEYPDFGMPWQEQTRIIGRPLGREQQAEELIAEVEAQIAAAREEHPELEGATVAWASPATDAGQFWVVGPNTPPMRFLTSLGLEFPAELAEIVGDKDSVQISGEQLRLLDADVLIWQVNSPEERAAIEDDPLYQQLDIAREGRAIFFVGLDDPLYGALSFSTVLSLPFAIDELVPELATAVDGDLQTHMDDTQATFSGLQVLETTDQYRRIKDALGEKNVPLAPKCIVAAGSGYLDHLLALGVKPCGAAHGPAGSGFPEYLADQLKDVAYVGGVLEINLEAVARLKPDLILAMHPAHTEGDFKTLLDPIATTVYLTEPWQDWRKAMTEIGLLLGKEDEAAQRLAAFERKLAEGKATLARSVGDESVIFLRDFPERLRVYGVTSPTGDILYHGLGLTPATLTPTDEHATEISLEQLPEIDADHIFLLDQTEDGMADLATNPLWQQLPAVQNKHVYPVDAKIWVQGEGMFAYETLVENVVQALSRTSRQ